MPVGNVSATAVAPERAKTSTPDPIRPFDRTRVVVGVLGRFVLAYVIGCALIVAVVSTLPGWNTWGIVSGSMSPDIRRGDVVLTQARHDGDYQPGRVITFVNANWADEPVTHRITSRDEGGNLTTRGDANPTDDPGTTSVDQVSGLGRLLVRWAAWPWLWMRTGQWLPLGAFVLTLIASSLAVRWDRDEPDPPAGARRSGPGVSGTRRRRRPGARTLPVAAAVLLVVAMTAQASTAAFSATTRAPGNSWAMPIYQYAATVLANSPWQYYQMADNNGTNGGTAAASSTPARNGTFSTVTNGYTFLQAGPAGIKPAPSYAVQLRAAGACLTSPTAAQLTNPQTFTVEAWFKVASGYTGGGKIVGFESTAAGQSSTYDRHIYMDNTGKLRFGLYNGGFYTITTAAAYNDGAWHHVAATLTAAGGTATLYVDGVSRGTLSGATAENTTGYFRFGCGILNLWPWGTGNSTANTTTLIGYLAQGAVYTTALSSDEIYFHWWIGR